MRHPSRVVQWAIVVTALFATTAAAQYSPYSSQVIVNSQGAKIGAFAIIRVCPLPSTGNPCNPTATIYFSTTGIEGSAPNPFNADQNGNFNFFAPPGNYIISATSGSTNYTFPVAVPPTVSTSQDCSTFVAADAGGQIQACINALPTTGGVADASNINGIQSAEASITLNKPVKLILGPITLRCNQSAGYPCLNPIVSNISISGAGGGATQLIQGTAGTTGNPRHLISNTANGSTSTITDIEISGLRLVGVPGTNYTGGNNGIDLIGVNRVNIHDNQCTTLQLECAKVQNSSNVIISDNEAYSVSGGIRLIGVQHFRIHHNNIHDTQNVNTVLSVPYAIDSVSGTGFSNSTDGVIDDNVAANYVNSQTILVHDGSNLTITGNVGDNVSTMVSLAPFASPDVVSNDTVTGNTYNGTSTNANQTTGYGIVCNGQNGSLLGQHISITGNTVINANNPQKFDLQGGIALNFCDDVDVSGNTVHGATGHGVELASTVTRAHIHGNLITNVAASTGSYQGCVDVLMNVSALTGKIEDNDCDNAAYGYRFDSYVPGIILGLTNIATNVSAFAVNTFNATVDYTLPVPERMSLGSGNAPIYLLEIQKQHNSGVLSPGTPTGTPNTAGTLAAGTYLTEWTYLNTLGQESTPGFEGSFIVSANGNISLNAPPSQPGMSQSYHVYATAANGSSGSEKLCDGGNGIPFANGYNITVACAGASPPVSNGTTGPELSLKVGQLEAPYTTDSTNGYAAQIQNQIVSGNTQNTTGIKGAATFEHDHFGTGTMSNQQGISPITTNRTTGIITTSTAVNANVENLGAGTISNANGITSQFINNSGGTLTQAIDFYAQAPSASTAIGTRFAFRCDSATTNATTKYCFYASGADPNYFGGVVTIDNGSNIVYRCSVAGTLRAGQLTTVSGDCGTAVDTGLRVP